MRCLCCDKELGDNISPEEIRVQWHKKCMKHFWGIKTMPYIDISDEVLKNITEENALKGYTVTGVQKKMSLHLDNICEKTRLTLVGYPAGYILKPQTDDYPCLPEAEFLVMKLARLTKICTVPFALMKASSGELCYITRRIDRENGNKLAMEDFCQLDERLTEDKYKGSYERCGKIISMYSSRAMLDMTEMYKRIVFSYCIGNSDMHLKNLSLIEQIPYSGDYTLSKAYDFLPVNVVNPADTEQMALTVNGKKKNIRRKDFLALAENCGIKRGIAEKIIDSVISLKETYVRECSNSYLSPALKEKMIELIEYRMGNI